MSDLMAAYVALLRAVNVGGTGKLPMAELKSICEAAGFSDVRTVLTSGNAVFGFSGAEADVRHELAGRLERRAGRPVGVLVRTVDEMTAVLARNPYADAPGDRVVALFTDLPVPLDPLAGATGRADERIAAGERELFVHYPSGQSATRLRLPAMREGTARNINTVARLAACAGARVGPRDVG